MFNMQLGQLLPLVRNSLIMKCFERQAKDYICSSLPNSPVCLPPKQSNRQWYNTNLHLIRSHLNSMKENHIKML